MNTNSDKGNSSKLKKKKIANQQTKTIQNNNEGFITRIIKKIFSLFVKPKKKDIKNQESWKNSKQDIQISNTEKKDDKATNTSTNIISETVANDIQSRPSDNKDDEDEGYTSKEEDDDSDQPKKFGERFLNKGKIKEPRSLREIAEESKKKSDLLKGQKFIESDAAKNDIKKVEEGFEKNTKKKSGKALEGKIFLIRGKDNGRAAWHYILVKQDNIRALRAQKAGCNIDVTDYGKIVKSGWGENPSDEIIKQIEEEYGD